MLQSLKDREPATARKALVDASGQVLREQLSTDGSAAAIISEALEKTKNASSAQKRFADIASILSRAISDVILPDEQREIVRKRLGQKGKLPISLYHVGMSPKFLANVNYSCVRENHARNAITRGEGVQHFVSVIEGKQGEPFRSLFTQNCQFTVLVNAMRNGDLLIVEDAYRVYHDEVDLNGAETPLEVMKAFLSVFGEDCTLELDGKLFLDRLSSFTKS